jgi:U3 small nucleolar RNA-associated protein MPP10
MEGTGSSSSSLTSTSHTLTHAAGTVMAMAGNNTATTAFLEAVSPENRHIFLQPSLSILNGSLELTKHALDRVAPQVSDEQQQRLREANKKRKRVGGDRTEVLKVRKLHVDGLETGQIWQQAKRIIASALQQSGTLLKEMEEQREIELVNDNAQTEDISPSLTFDDSGSGLRESGQEEESDTSGSGTGMEDDSLASEEEDLMEGMSDLDGEDPGSPDAFQREESGDESVDGESEEAGSEESEAGGLGSAEEPSEATAALNDDFFSLHDFNKQTRWFEDQDARGDPNTDHASDDEALDWHADPFGSSAPSRSKDSKKTNTSNSVAVADFGISGDAEESDDQDDGPRFEDMDLFAPEGASDDEDATGMDDVEAEMDLTANDIYYKDFFAPPPRKAKKAGTKRPPELSKTVQPDQADVDRAMDLVKRDLFDDDHEGSESEDALSDVSAGDPKARRSAHERRQAKLSQEIRQLEAELVNERPWMLSGEAAAVDRPVNSLLEEDFDFEHAGKPIPVVTEEVSESIEGMIKRRILAQEFDEVVRRRPDSLGDPTGTRRGLVDVDDNKAKQSLAEIYEEEHVKNSNPNSYVSKADKKLQEEEKEVEQMWKAISARLDALSSWSFKPKPATPTLTVVADVATVTMEDAQPTTAQGVAGGESMLAPQEVYKAGKDTAGEGEVVAKSGLPVAKQEMSREEKLRRRRREKERKRKATGIEASKPVSRTAQIRNETLGSLKRGGVTVINRKGEMVGMDGKATTGPKAVSSSGSFKL